MFYSFVLKKFCYFGFSKKLLMRHIFALIILIFPFRISGQDQLQVKAQNFVITQPAINSSGVLQLEYIRDLYLSANSTPSEIKQGEEYISYYYRSKTTPLLFDGKEFVSTIYFNGRKYVNIKLQYDTFLDEVLYTDTSRLINFQFPKIALNKNLVGGFIFFTDYDSLKFSYLRFPKSPGNDMNDGFYEVIYTQGSRALIKHKSLEYISQAVNEYKYTPELYVSIGDKYLRIKNNKDLIRAFQNHSHEIKEFLGASKIKIKHAAKSRIVEALKYYDSLLKSDTDLK
jgi:hypothetical protein